MGMVALAIVAGYLLWLVLGWAWYTWGLIAALALVSAVLIGLGWMYDKRQQKRRAQMLAS
jgi:hypothetical protein